MVVNTRHCYNITTGSNYDPCLYNQFDIILPKCSHHSSDRANISTACRTISLFSILK